MNSTLSLLMVFLNQFFMPRHNAQRKPPPRAVWTYRFFSSAMIRSMTSGSHFSARRNPRIPPFHVRMSARSSCKHSMPRSVKVVMPSSVPSSTQIFSPWSMLSELARGCRHRLNGPRRPHRHPPIASASFMRMTAIHAQTETSQAVSCLAYGSSLLGRSGVWNAGSTIPSRKYFLIVLREMPVRRAISRMGILSRSAHFLITFKNPMSITPYASSWFKPRQGCTWVNSQ